MHDAAPGEDAARRSALLLHGLSPQDRHWLLDRLAPAQRERVQLLIGQLQEMSLAPDRATVARLLQEAQGHDATAPRHEPTEDDAVVARGMPASRLALALKNEPSALLVQLLARQPDAWRRAFLAQVPAARRTKLQHALADAAHGYAAQPLASTPRLDAAILRAVERLAQDEGLAAPRHGAAATAPPLAARPNGWTRLRRWMGQETRSMNTITKITKEPGHET